MRIFKHTVQIITNFAVFILLVPSLTPYAQTNLEKYINAIREKNESTRKMIILNNKSEFANIFYSALEETYSIIENSDRTEDIQKAGYALIFLADIAMDYSIVFPYEL